MPANWNSITRSFILKEKQVLAQADCFLVWQGQSKPLVSCSNEKVGKGGEEKNNFLQ